MTTRTDEALQIFAAALPTLDADRLETVITMLKSWSGPSIYEQLPELEKAKIDQALDRLDQGRSVPAETVFEGLAQKLKAATQ